MSIQVRHPDEAEREQMSALSTQAFTASSHSYDPESAAWRPPLDRTYVADVDDRLVGQLSWWSMGHWLDGRCVPMSGVAGVAVDPSARGTGVASVLLRRLLHDLHDRGQAMASLFPMNLALYRKSGWEIGGTWPRHKIAALALSRLPRPTSRLEVRPSTLDDLDDVIAVYDAVARDEPGMLRRERIKCRSLAGPKPPGYGYVVLRDGSIVGYLSYSHRSVDEGSDAIYDLDVNELVALDGDAYLTLWRLLGSSAPAAADVEAVLGPNELLHLLLPDRAIRGAGQWWWMTRLVDPAAAFAARGWRLGVSTELHLDVVDPVLDTNNGPYVLTVADGQGRLERGGRGKVRVGVGLLSSLFTGWADARQARSAGLLLGADDSDAEALESVFGGRTPWVRSFF